jgi:uncharacterized membrane protein
VIAFDGNPFDMATIGIAFFGCFIRPTKRAFKKKVACFTYRDMVVDFLNGTIIVPFFLLVGAAFSSTLLEEALKTNKLFLAVGGVIALLFVFKEYANGD